MWWRYTWNGHRVCAACGSEGRQAGHRITVPVLLVTGEDETQLADASDIWRGRTLDLRAVRVPGGHFIPEQASDELTDVFLRFLEPDHK